MNYDFTDKELWALNYIVTSLMVHNRMNPYETSPNKFNVMGTFSTFQTLQDKGIVWCSFKPSFKTPVMKNQQYFWYLTDDGKPLIDEMIAMRKL